MRQPTIGLLPLYMKLYDDIRGEKRPRIEGFYGIVARELEKRCISVVTVPICRVKNEFAAAVKKFEESDVDAIVTLHVAYSPSLESAEALAGTSLPLIVCDTTPVYSFSTDQEPEELLFNQGIHGVQDMCNLLIRNGKSFEIVVGHWEKSDVLDQTAGLVRAARMASHMRRMKAGLIGTPFEGMGDFNVPPERLKRTIGLEVVSLDPARYLELATSVTDEDIRREREEDRKRFLFDGLDEEVYLRSLRAGLAVEKWIDSEGLSAFSYNFLDFNRKASLNVVPFLAASKMMARGIGFAGEGDILTASLVSAIALYNPDTSFTEMFCPDWAHDAIFLSHMGEMNHRLASGKPKLVEMNYPYGDADNPVIATGRFKAGEVLLVDLAPVGEREYRLIMAPARILDVPEDSKWQARVRAWMAPPIPLRDFLGAYSRHGGTHHLALTYGASKETVEAFGRIMGWETVTIE